MANKKGVRRDMRTIVSNIMTRLAENPEMFMGQRELWLSICRYFQSYDGQITDKQKWVLENADRDIQTYINPLSDTPPLPFK